MKKHEIISLRTGMAIPFLYFGAVIVTAFLHPGFSFVHAFASNLGSIGAPYAYIFNGGLMLVSVASFIAAFGFWRAFHYLGVKSTRARLTCLIIAMFGMAILMAGMFPWPEYPLLHRGFGLVLPISIGPVMLASALGKRDDMRWLRNYLLWSNTLMIGVLALYFELINTTYIGLGQFFFTLVTFPWLGVSAYVLSSCVSKESPATANLKNNSRSCREEIYSSPECAFEGKG